MIIELVIIEGTMIWNKAPLARVETSNIRVMMAETLAVTVTASLFRKILENQCQGTTISVLDFVCLWCLSSKFQCFQG